MRALYTLLLLLFASVIFAQPANDNCTSAQNITLPLTPPCPNGNGATVTITGTTVNATPSNPYLYMTGCSGGGSQQAPALDVWYSFVATGNILNLGINSTFATPNIGLWGGNCSSLQGIECARGNNAGILNYTNTSIIPGQTYFIQVSGNTPTASGTFTLTIDNDLDCNNCLTTASITAIPAPVNGTYQAGQTVQICFTVDGFTQVAQNWLHGIEYTFGPGWDLATLTSIPSAECPYDPTPGPGNLGSGTWAWYNSVTSGATGITHGPGFFFDNLNVAGTDPGQNFGDPTNGTCTWTFCITLKVSGNCTEGESLNITINTLADGESGSWSNPACFGDPNFTLSAVMTCCPPPPIALNPQTFCSNTNPTVANLTATGTSLQWYNVSTGGSPLTGTTALVSGTCYVSQTVSGCESGRTPVTVTITTTALPIATSPQTFCSNTNPTVANLTATGTSLQWYNVSTGGSPLPGTTALVSGTYYVTQTMSGCESGRTPVTVTITTTVLPTATSPQTFCSNTNPTVANLTATGTNLQWYNVATGGSALAGTTALVSGTYYVSQTISGCESGRSPVTVTITTTALPSATSPQTFCSNINPTVVNLTATGTNLQWYNASTGGSALVGTTALVPGTYYVSQTVSGCESGRVPVTVTITTTPLPTATSPQTFCSNTNPTVANLTATGTNLQWYNVATGGSALAGTTALVSGTYYVSQTISGCESGRSPVTVTITTTALPSATSPQTFCSNINPTVVNLTATGTNLQWYNASTGGSALVGTTALVPGTYYVSQTVSGCESGRTPVTVTITTTPLPTATSPQTFCSNTNPTVANLTATGTNLQWYNVATGGSALAGTTALVSGTYYVSQTVSGCESGRTPVTVTIATTPLPTATSPQTFCSNTNPTIANLTATGANLQWYNSSTGGSALAGTTALVPGTYYVSQTISGCESGRSPVTVTITTTALPSATSPQTFCSNINPTVVNLTATGTNLQWYNASTGGSALAGTTALVSATYYVSQTVSGCESGRTPVTVTITTTPLPTATSPQTFCSNTNPTIANLTATGTNLQWYNASTGGSALAGTTALVSGTYYISQTVSGCESGRTPVTVTIAPTPLPTATNPQTFCSNTNPAIANLIATGANLQWYNVVTGGSALAGTTALVPGTYYVSQTVNGCESGRTPVTVTIAPTPLPTATSPQTFCSNTNPTVANLTATGTNLQWYNVVTGGSALAGTTALVPGTYYVSQTVNGCESGRANVTVTLNSFTVSVNIIASSTSICSGGSITFTATPNNGGSTPTYQWMINGVNVAGQTASTFTTLTLVNGNTVSVIMTSNDPCANPTTATSNPITITTTSVTPSVLINASSTSICSGGSVTFTATPTNGGSTPSYQWMINGVNVAGQTASTFSTATLANGNTVSVIMTSNDPCANPTTATSNPITITTTSVTPSVLINASSTSICSGGSVTFTATPTNGGSNPTYQWMINGVNVAGQTASTFTTSTLANGNTVSVMMASNDPCANPATTTSNPITISTTSVTPSVTITSTSTSICNGGSITFTATPTNGGSTPTYQWMINGVNVAGQTASTFTTSTLANGNTVSLIMASNDPCANPATATSNPITITTTSVTPSVTITSGTTSICSGGSVTFTATPTNGGSTPTYQWMINGVNVAGQTASTFTTSTLTNGNTVSVIMTSNDPCASSVTPVQSQSITIADATPVLMITNPLLVCEPASIDLTASPVTTGSGAGLTFTYWLDANATIPFANPGTVTVPGTYYIKAQSAGGCFTIKPVVVSIEQKINGIRYPTVTAMINSPLQLTARNRGPAYSYTWSPPTGLNFPNTKDPIFTNNTSLEYLITITSSAGCVTVDTLLVRIDGPVINGPAVFVPKAWSPNNDGHNDYLLPFLVNITRIKYFRIYNRWGIKVFETNVIGQGWNGIYNGKPQVIDVYTWTIETEAVNGTIYKSAGTAVLLR